MTAVKQLQTAIALCVSVLNVKGGGVKYLAIDTECTTFQKGDPFSQRNKLVCYSTYNGETEDLGLVEHQSTRSVPYGSQLLKLQAMIIQADMLLGFNLKRDYHWLKRYGIDFKEKPIWDAQTAAYLISRQKDKLISLDELCERYGLPKKDDKIKAYWEAGIDTDQIPLEELRDYALADAKAHFLCCIRQMEDPELSGSLRKLIWLYNKDFYNLQECEWNGLPYDIETSLERAKQIRLDIKRIDSELSDITGYSFINWNSDYHISAALFGGVVKEDYRQAFIFEYKDGTTKEKQRWSVREHKLPQLIKPIGDKQASGKYSTDEGTLKKLKRTGSTGRIISRLLERAKLDKLAGTYFEGLPKLYGEMDWTGETLHGSLLQNIAITGRLASSKPNRQNFVEDVLPLIHSRYK